MTTAIQSPASIFLVDDHPAVLQGLALLLAQENFIISGEATCLEDLLSRISFSRPDMALVDLTLCEESGMDLLHVFRTRNIPVVIYSMHEDVATIRRVLERGAQGYVTKRESSSVLLEALQEILQGRQYISPRAQASIAGSTIQSRQLATSSLSERETEIMNHLSNGEPNSEIAEALGVSIRTVETYCTRIAAKLELSGMKALRKYAIQNQQIK